MCYLRATPSFDNAEAKFLFYDFECSQDQIVQCSEGYMANVTENCTQCSTEEKCKSCSKCKNSLQSWCGKQEHRPKFVVAHTVCGECIDDPVTLQSTCVVAEIVVTSVDIKTIKDHLVPTLVVSAKPYFEESIPSTYLELGYFAKPTNCSLL